MTKIAYLLFVVASLAVCRVSQAQWNSTGDSFTTGRIGIGTSTLSDYDIDISRSNTNSGIRVFNDLGLGRSIIVFGEGFGGRYGYVAHHGQTHNAGTNYTQTFRPSSTVLVGSDVNGLGIISEVDIRFTTGGLTDGSQKMVINSGGNVGIGELNPVARLHAVGSIFSNAARTNTIFSGNIGANNANFVGTEGYWALRTATDNSFNLDVFNSSTPVTAIKVVQNGNVSIGTTDPNSFKLAVGGKIGASEVVVTLERPWPDYVFETDHKLLSLSELEVFIKANKHLPELPTAEEVKESGVSLGEMNAILLKKLEELTLYVIQQNQNIEEIRMTNKLQRDTIAELQDQVRQITCQE